MIRLTAFLLVLIAATGYGEPVLRWAADPNSNAPYTFFNSSKTLTGFEREIIDAIGRRIGRRTEFVQNDWNGLIPGLHRGLYDCVICGIEITPEKAQEVTFSIPYYLTFEQLVTRRTQAPLSSLDQLRGKQIGTLDQTAALRMLENTPGVVVKVYDQEVSAYQDVVNGRLYGVLLDYPIAKYYSAPYPILEFTGPPFGRVSYGIAIDKNNPALEAEINGALRDLISSGELRNILSRWGLWTESVAQAFNQPTTPSGPDSEYRAFIRDQGMQSNFWSRLRVYAGAWRVLRHAALLTVAVSVAAMVVAIIAGFVLATCRVFGPLSARWLATAYIELVRGTPLLIQLLFIFLRPSDYRNSIIPFCCQRARSRLELCSFRGRELSSWVDVRSGGSMASGIRAGADPR